jgi:hypothetical protein
LSLEEVRATIRALDNIATESRQVIINRVYPEKVESPESKIFTELRSVTGDRWTHAWLLTLLVENLNPENPRSELEKLQTILKMESASTWPDKRWDSWIESRRELNEVLDFISESVEDPQKLLEATVPHVFIFGTSRGTIIICPDTMRLKVFFESIRQQLVNPDTIQSLICPFKGQGQSCCGFGHYLQGIWTAIPNEYRRRLKPPSKICLK